MKGLVDIQYGKFNKGKGIIMKGYDDENSRKKGLIVKMVVL